jgi:hypothetical protein
MSIAARHLQTRRPRKDRGTTWSRSLRNGVVTWSLWRRDHRGALHMRTVSLHIENVRGDSPSLRKLLRVTWRELRDFVDEIDLALMEDA